MRFKQNKTPLLSQKKTKPTRRQAKPAMLAMGLMVAAVSVFVGTAGVANATPGNTTNGYGGGGINIDIGNIIGDGTVIVIIVNYFVGS